MTIDEAIEELKNGAYLTNREEEQFAEWLEELKDYRDKNKMVVRVDVENMDSIKDKIEELSIYAENQYNKAIDDAKSVILQTLDNEILVDTLHLRLEQLKAGETDGDKDK